jgi:hypothetical protein
VVIGRTVQLSLHTLLTALRDNGGAGPHCIFAGGARYIPAEAATQVSGEALAELAGEGLASGNRLSGDFEDVLHVLERPDRECYAHIRTGDEHFGVLVASRGRTGVTALHQDHHVWLKPADDRDLEAALVAHLPQFPPADFTPFSLPQREFQRRDDDGGGVYDEPESRGYAARELDDVLAAPYYGLGYLHVAHRANGTREVATDTLSYLDIDAGRVGLEMSGPRGSQHIAVFPGEPDRLAARLASVRARLG